MLNNINSFSGHNSGGLGSAIKSPSWGDYRINTYQFAIPAVVIVELFIISLNFYKELSLVIIKQKNKIIS